MLKRLICVLIALSFVMTLPFGAIADESISLDLISNKIPGATVTIGGQTTFNEVNIKVVRPNSTVLYVDVANTTNGSYNSSFQLPADAETGKYTVVVGQGSVVAIKTFAVDSTSSSGSSGGGGGSISSSKSISSSGGSVAVSGASISIPVNAIESMVKVKIERLKSISSLQIAGNGKIISEVYEITKDKTGKFGKLVTITLIFDKSKVDLLKYDLSLCWLDESSNRWVQLENVDVSLDAGKMSGQVDHFTKFAVIATEKTVEVPTQTPQLTAGVILTDIVAHWAEGIIKEMVANEITGGYPDGTFRPDNNITRAEFAVFLVRAFNLHSDNGKVFADTESHWAKNDVATVAAYGIVNGYDANNFGPNDLITREQMALMIVRAAKLATIDEKTTFADAENISDWAKSSVTTATKSGIINGYPDNTFRPKSNATRAEAVTVIFNTQK